VIVPRRQFAGRCGAMAISGSVIGRRARPERRGCAPEGPNAAGHTSDLGGFPSGGSHTRSAQRGLNTARAAAAAGMGYFSPPPFLVLLRRILTRSLSGTSVRSATLSVTTPSGGRRRQSKAPAALR
jgi:hypothetical protein